MDPDQLASSADLDLTCLQEKPADQDPYCLQELIYIWFHTVFERINCLSTVRCKLICSFGQNMKTTANYFHNNFVADKNAFCGKHFIVSVFSII